jgi:pyridoxine 4-dehydrogenase
MLVAPHAGKYSLDRLPPGPRGSLFRQLLPGIQPVLTTLEAVAGSRRKTMSQVGG